MITSIINLTFARDLLLWMFKISLCINRIDNLEKSLKLWYLNNCCCLFCTKSWIMSYFVIAVALLRKMIISAFFPFSIFFSLAIRLLVFYASHFYCSSFWVGLLLFHIHFYHLFVSHSFGDLRVKWFMIKNMFSIKRHIFILCCVLCAYFEIRIVGAAS